MGHAPGAIAERYIFVHNHRQKSDIGIASALKTPNPDCSKNHFLTQDQSSDSFFNSSTIWEPSIQFYMTMVAILTQTLHIYLCPLVMYVCNCIYLWIFGAH